MPIGTVIDFAGVNMPAKWLECAGQTVGRVAYAELFGVLGTTYGEGDGETTFNLPDLRDRCTIGESIGGLTDRPSARVMGESGGEETHVLTKPELATHNHGLNDPGHNHTPASGGYFRTLIAGTAAALNGGNTLTKLYDPTTSTNATGVTVQDEGADEPHNNCPPFLVLKKLIYSGV